MSEPAGQPDQGPPTTLVLVRHARTAFTGRTFTGGPGDEFGPPLDDAGERQAVRLAEVFRTPREDLPAPAALICSPYLRTRQTAHWVGSVLGLPPEVDDGWIEVAGPEEAAIDRLVRRVGAARDRLLARHQGRCAVVVTHAGPVRAVLAAALDAGPAAVWRLRTDPASLNVVRFWSDGGCEVVSVNDVGHLREPAGEAAVPTAGVEMTP